MKIARRGFDEGPVDLPKSVLTFHPPPPPFLRWLTLTFPCTDFTDDLRATLCLRAWFCSRTLNSPRCPLPCRFHFSTMQASTSCKACTCRQSKIRRDIWQHSCEFWNCPRRKNRKFSLEPEAASWFWKLLFPFAPVLADDTYDCAEMGTADRQSLKWSAVDPLGSGLMHLCIRRVRP